MAEHDRPTERLLKHLRERVEELQGLIHHRDDGHPLNDQVYGEIRAYEHVARWLQENKAAHSEDA